MIEERHGSLVLIVTQKPLAQSGGLSELDSLSQIVPC